jgi:P-type conjugative transfer protein TrbJ
MHRAILITTLALLVGVSRPADAIFGIGDIVLDPSNLLQNTLQVLRQLQQIANEAQMIAQQVQQYKTMMQNLQQGDFGAALQVVQLAGQTTGLLTQTQGISYDLNAAMQAFNDLYPAVQQVMKTSDQVKQLAKWHTTRRDVAQGAMQISAIAGSLKQSTQMINTLLTTAKGAPGALAAQQALAQQNALTQSMLGQMHATLAAQTRLQAVQAAEDASKAEAEAAAWQQAITPGPAYQGSQGRLVRYRW